MQKNFISKFFSFFAGVVDTADKHSRISPRIFEKIWNGPNGILRGPGDTDLWKKSYVENLVSDRHGSENMVATFGTFNYCRGSLRKTVLYIFAVWTQKPLLYCKWLPVLKYQLKKLIKAIKKPENRGVDSGTNRTTMTLQSILDVFRSGYWVFKLQQTSFRV